MAWMNNIISFKEQLKASAREVTEVESLLGGESFITETLLWKGLSSQNVGGEIRTAIAVRWLGVQRGNMGYVVRETVQK